MLGRASREVDPGSKVRGHLDDEECAVERVDGELKTSVWKSLHETEPGHKRDADNIFITPKKPFYFIRGRALNQTVERRVRQCARDDGVTCKLRKKGPDWSFAAKLPAQVHSQIGVQRQHHRPAQ